MDERLTHASDIHDRHLKRQQQRRIAMKRRRIIFFSLLTIIFISIIMFFTPLFNIKHINITGNQKVDSAQIKQSIGNIEDENLFRLKKKKIIENVKTIPYIDNVEIKKRIFPTGINVTVYECTPVGYIAYNSEYLILDKKLKVLEISQAPIEGLFEISGIGVSGATPGAVISTDDQGKITSITECMSGIIDHGIQQNINVINFTDMNNITFTYENRLNVVCGSSIDFQKKISMFKKAVTSSKLTANSRGTIDISISGKAIYTP